MAERCAALPLLRAAWQRSASPSLRDALLRFAFHLILAMPIALLGFAAPLAVLSTASLCLCFAPPSPRHALRRFAMPSLCLAIQC
jgi:hypothetical protein